MTYNSTINYLLEFLLKDKAYVKYVGYTNDPAAWSHYKVVIVPSSLFKDHAEARCSMPQLPLKELDGMPILFGEPIVKQVNSTWVIYADLVASALFLLSRYEETLVAERDVHGRFQAVSSLAYKAGFLQRPLVDEYGAYLRQCLAACGVELPQSSQKMTITLTHDVDVPFEHRTTRSFIGGILRGQVKNAFKNAFSSLKNNTAYTFPWLLEQDANVPHAKQIYFMRMPLQPCVFDKPYLNYRHKDMQKLLGLLRKHPITWGWHVSYQAESVPHLYLAEKFALEQALGCKISCSRNHYLRTCIPDNFISLQEVGILHDYTVGYADCVGFRLGTCRPVRFISPTTLQVEHIMVHPLAIMDVTLSNYMQLSYQQALETSLQIIEQVRKYQGELVLLWHNTSLTRNAYHRQLYKNIIAQLNAQTI